MIWIMSIILCSAFGAVCLALSLLALCCWFYEEVCQGNPKELFGFLIGCFAIFCMIIFLIQMSIYLGIS